MVIYNPVSFPSPSRLINLINYNFISGQAISLLVRTYNYTGNPLYLEACHRALDLFSVNINHGGIRSYFLNQSDLVWFEEYPFDPPIHILNGFIYSLIGLYDYTKVSLTLLKFLFH